MHYCTQAQITIWFCFLYRSHLHLFNIAGTVLVIALGLSVHPLGTGEAEGRVLLSLTASAKLRWCHLLRSSFSLPTAAASRQLWTLGVNVQGLSAFIGAETLSPLHRFLKAIHTVRHYILIGHWPRSFPYYCR